LFKHVGVAILTLALAACGGSTPRRAASPSSNPNPSGASLQSLPAAGTYRVDSAQSELRLLVYRGGPLAHLGHNHVMVNHAVTGTVTIDNNLSASSFTLSLPAAAFVVDDFQARREEGADFAGEIPQDAKSGTLHNMLGPALLNEARYPTITVKSIAIVNLNGIPTATLIVSLVGHDSTVQAPFTLQGDSHQLTASGAFELRQTAIGLTPYSLFGGALLVEDVMQLKFRIVVSLEG
jgi:hypothetical protein